VIALLLRAATVRTYWFLEDKRDIAATALAALVVQILVIALENTSKRRWFLPVSNNISNNEVRDGENKEKQISKEESAGFLSRSFLVWINHLLLAGYRRPIQLLHLQGVCDRGLVTEKVTRSFHLLQSPTKTTKTTQQDDDRKDSGYGLIGTAFRCLGVYFLVPVLPRLCVTAFTFSQPLLASALTSYLASQGTAEAVSRDRGYGLVGATGLVYLGIAVCINSAPDICTSLLGETTTDLRR